MPRTAQRHLSNASGMSLVELLIAIGITSVIMAISLGIFNSQYKSYRRGHATKAVQTDNQVVIDLVREDLGLAGWGVLPQMSFVITDGGSTGQDTLFINDASLLSPANYTQVQKIVDATYLCAGCATYSGVSASTALDVNSDGSSDFISVPVITWDGTVAASNVTNSSGVLAASAGASVTVTPAIEYCVGDADTATCPPTTSTKNWAILRFSRETAGVMTPLAANVVDIQVVYSDGTVTYGAAGCAAATPSTCSMSPFNPKPILWMDLYIVTRSADRTRQISDTGSCRPAVANHAAGTSAAECGYDYKVYTTRVTPLTNFTRP